MTELTLTQDVLKQTIKEAVAETLREESEIFYDIIRQVLEDFALAEAINEGRQTELVDRQEIFDLFDA